MVGASTVPAVTGCLGFGSDVEIEYKGSNSRTVQVPTPGTNSLINERHSNFVVKVPPEADGSININLTKGSIVILGLDRFGEDDNEVYEGESGSGTAILFSAPEHDKFTEGESASGYGVTVTNDQTYVSNSEIPIDDTRQTLVMQNIGREETNTEKALHGRVEIIEKVPLVRDFTSPVVSR